MKAKLIWITPEAEKVIAYCARVSNPANQNNPDTERLIRYCAIHKHWSVFEMANACLEIQTSRAITAQIIRHRSFSFQEFSQRYAKVQEFEPVAARRQDDKNRQNSIDDLSEEVRAWWTLECNAIFNAAADLYGKAVAKGIAKECARMVLPMSSSSRIYMNGTIRSWIHYIEVRGQEGTQKEHRDIAVAVRKILTAELPMIANAMGWTHKEG